MRAVAVHSLSFAYQQQRVLENLNFSIEEKEAIGIIGPNGGGKTTLLLLLMGFLKPTSGSITLFGKSPREVRGKIGYVPQAFRYDKDFPITVLEVTLGGRLHSAPPWGNYSREDKKQALASLEKVGMERWAHTSFSQLSGGQAQRVLLARALVSHPSLLLLDEPTANVDQAAQGEIYHHLETLKGQLTLLMVTHDLRAAVKHVDRVLCVEREISSLSPKEVCQHFAIGLYHPTSPSGES